MKGRNKMDENAKKNERELRKYRAKLRMDYYPLPLGWFKFFRYVSIILNIINCISVIGSYILLAAATNSAYTVFAMNFMDLVNLVAVEQDTF